MDIQLIFILTTGGSKILSTAYTVSRPSQCPSESSISVGHMLVLAESDGERKENRRIKT
jgi:hypothetical protein